MPVFGRRAIIHRALPADLTPEAITPSSLHNQFVGTIGTRIDVTYGTTLDLDIEGVTDSMKKGTLLHRAFEVLAGHPDRADILSDAVGKALTHGQVSSIVTAVGAFDCWLDKYLRPQAIHSEVPLLTLNSEGTIVSGFADMVVEAADGLWIVDHKSDQISTDYILQERFNTYYPQVKCYADALQTARSDKPVRGVILNWVSYGKVSLMESVHGL